MVILLEPFSDGSSAKRQLLKAQQQKKSFTVDAVVQVLLLVWTFLWETVVALFLGVQSYFLQPKSLRGKVCLVTGAGRGLGRELCLSLAKEGAIIACADINDTNNRGTVSMVKELGVEAKPYHVNVASKKEVDDLVKQVESDLGPVHLLINNAAIVMPMMDSFYSSHFNINTWKDKEFEEFVKASFNVNILGHIWATFAVMPSMVARNEGHVVNISSEAAFVPFHGLKIYGPTKAALTNFGRSVRMELDCGNPNNAIKVTNVHPTFINTSLDYTSLLDTKLKLFEEVSSVVDTIMTAIKYQQEDVYFPKFHFPGLVLSQFAPSRFVMNVMKVLITSARYPSQEQFFRLPVGDLVKSCSFVNEKKSK